MHVHPRLSLEEYDEVELSSDRKFEFIEGEIVAMAGGSFAHGRLAAEILGAFVAQLRGGPCVAAGSDVRIGHDATGFRAYPDALILCGAPEMSPLKPKDTLLNPRVIVEVTSEKTEKKDRGPKLYHYKLMESVAAVIIVSHRERRVTVHERGDGGWGTREVRAGAVVVSGVPVTFDVRALYDAAVGTDFEPGAP